MKKYFKWLIKDYTFRLVSYSLLWHFFEITPKVVPDMAFIISIDLGRIEIGIDIQFNRFVLEINLGFISLRIWWQDISAKELNKIFSPVSKQD